VTAFVTSSLAKSSARSSRSHNPNALTASDTIRRAEATLEATAAKSADFVAMITDLLPCRFIYPDGRVEHLLGVIARGTEILVLRCMIDTHGTRVVPAPEA
jgi:hypothetical protein